MAGRTLSAGAGRVIELLIAAAKGYFSATPTPKVVLEHSGLSSNVPIKPYLSAEWKTSKIGISLAMTIDERTPKMTDV